MILWIFKAQLITDCGHTIQFQLGGTLVESDDPTCVSSNKRPTMSVVETFWHLDFQGGVSVEAGCCAFKLHRQLSAQCLFLELCRICLLFGLLHTLQLPRYQSCREQSHARLQIDMYGVLQNAQATARSASVVRTITPFSRDKRDNQGGLQLRCTSRPSTTHGSSPCTK